MDLIKKYNFKTRKYKDERIYIASNGVIKITVFQSPTRRDRFLVVINDYQDKILGEIELKNQFLFTKLNCINFILKDYINYVNQISQNKDKKFRLVRMAV